MFVSVYEPDHSLDDAAIYAPTGEKLASFRSSEGIGDAQITASGRIWVPYGDHSEEGHLDCFDTDGRILFRYYPFWKENDLPPMVDCYALNKGWYSGQQTRVSKPQAWPGPVPF